MNDEERTPSPAEPSATDAAERVRREAPECRFVDLQFTDVTGALKSVVVPLNQLEDILTYGHWFDGSALEGGARTMETDLLLRPDLSTWAVLPWQGTHGERTARLLCDVQLPDGEPFAADPRAVLKRAVLGAGELGYHFRVAAEVEFFLFRSPRLGDPRAEHYVAAGPADSGGYFDLAHDEGGRIRDEIVQALGTLGVPVEASHHEIAPGQHEIDLPLLPALEAADAVVTCKYAVRTIARTRGLVATFMPKPLADTAGSGLHLHQALLDRDESDALGDPADEHGLSETGRRFIAGQLAHVRAMCSVLCPTVNSYKRIGRGFDAPSYLAWGHASPRAVIRVPLAPPRRRSLRQPGAADSGTNRAPRPLRIELRCPDPACNPYLALAAALAAGIDGIRTAATPPAPAESHEDLSSSMSDESQVEVLPASLGEAIGELEWDPVIRDALGQPVYERLLLAKEQEWEEYRRQISAWEIGRYFESA